jgi:hypothetical protein
MLQITGQQWKTTQHSTLEQSVIKNGARFTGMMIVMATTMMMIDDFQKAVNFSHHYAHDNNANKCK